MFKVCLGRNVRAVRLTSIRPSLLTSQIGLISNNSVRYNSSVPSTPSSEIKTQLTSFSENVADEASKVASTLTSDQYGYLESIGLAQSWRWPTDILQHVLEIVHVSTGLPWWATIIVTTFTARALIFPFYIKSSDMSAKISKAKPENDALLERARAADFASSQQIALERRSINKKYGIKYRYVALPLIQFPIAIGMYYAIRGMCNYPVPGMSDQGILWFQDLTLADPYVGLQVLTAVVFSGFMKLGGESGSDRFSPAIKKLLTFLPFVSIPLTMNLSAGVVLYFAANGLWSISQTALLKNKKFRKAFKMSDIVKAPVDPKAPTTLKGTFQKIVADNKIKAENKMKEAQRKQDAMDVAIQQREYRQQDGFARAYKRPKK